MRKHLLNLLAVGLFSMSFGYAAAETIEYPSLDMTYVNYDAADESYGFVTEAKTGYNKISNGEVAFANTGWGANYVTYILVDLHDLKGKSLGNVSLSLDISGIEGKRPGRVQVGYNNSEWSSLTWNTADHTFNALGEPQETTTKAWDVFETKTFDITDAFKDSKNYVVTIIAAGLNANYDNIKNPRLTVEAFDASTAATVTLKWVCGTEVLQTKDVTVGKGEHYEVTDADKAPIVKDGVKYVYESDNAAVVTAAEGAVVTFVYTEAPMYVYKATNNVDNVVVSGGAYEGEQVKVPFREYIEKDGVLWYKAAINSEYSQTITMNESVMNVELEYTESDITNVVFFKEAEEIEGMTVASGQYVSIRCSNCKGAYTAEDEKVTVCTLPAGTYTLTGQVRNCTPKFYLGDAEEPFFDKLTSDGSIVSKTSEPFTLTATTEIKVNVVGDNRGNALDWVYVQSQTPQGISAVAAPAQDGKIYNLQGVEVQNPQKGIYIQNGKKFIVR